MPNRRAHAALDGKCLSMACIAIWTKEHLVKTNVASHTRALSNSIRWLKRFYDKDR